MKVSGRPKSKNIEDRRSPFGSDSVNPNYEWKNKVGAFYGQSITGASRNERSGMKFTKNRRKSSKK